MSKHKKYRWYYRWWIRARMVVAGIIILAGVLIGLLSLLLPFESLYQERLERFLEKQWDLKVNIESVTGSWQGYGPYFQFNDLELVGKQSVQLASADLSINVYQLLIPGGRTGMDLSINQVELSMTHTPNSDSLTLTDAADEANLTDMLDRILATGSIRIDQMAFNLVDEKGQMLLQGLQADLLLQQDEKRRALRLLVEHDGQSIELIGQGLRTQSLTKDANWYIKFNQFELSQWNGLLNEWSFPAGVINGQIWASAAAGHVSTLSGEVSWNNPVSDFGFIVKLKQFSEDKDWLASLLFTEITLDNQSHDEFIVRLKRESDITQVNSQDIPMAWLGQLLMDFNHGAEAAVQSFHISGLIDQFDLSWNHDQHNWQGNLDFSGLTVTNNPFSVGALNGEFKFDAAEGHLLLDSEAGHLKLPQLYRGELKWQDLSMQSTVDWSGEQPVLNVNQLWCDCADYGLKAWAILDLNQPMNLLLTSELNDVDVASLRKYWPYKVWKPKTMEWLDRGLLGGRVDKGYVFFNGNLVPKALKTNAATFISRAYTRDVDNLFHPQWPQVEDIDAVAVFTQDSVQVEVSDAKTMGMEVLQAAVDIASFDEGIVDVKLQANAQNNQLLDYIRVSPLVKNIQFNEGIEIGGKQKVDLSFEVPIKSEINLPFMPKGEVVFDRGLFLTDHFSIENINGPVKLDGYNLGLSNLPAQLGDDRVVLNGSIVTKSDVGVKIDVALDGSLSAGYLLDKIQQDLPIKGQSDWHIEIQNEHNQLSMSATSDLVGTTIELPHPLEKSAAEGKQLTITCEIPCQESSVDINFNNEIKSTLTGESGLYHLAKLQFINSSSNIADGELFGGHMSKLNLDKWLQLIANRAQSTTEQTSEPNWPTKQITINVDELLFMSRAFENLTLNIERLEHSYLIKVEGEQMQGLVEVDDNLAQKGIVAQFEHLDWIKPIDGLDELEDTEAESKVPDIHLWSKSFKYAGIPLGEMRMEMRNVADGVKVEQLSLNSAEATINASGFWNKAVGISDFNIVMTSERIADFLQGVGFAAPISNAQTLIELNAQWDGIPSAFNIAQIDGLLNIKIGQGQVLNQNPGFGRVLGLFNLTNLPRRLILDFRDVLADGLVFSEMEGNFKIAGGIAATQDFTITASSAKIHIQGDVGFEDQSYDQTITVRPQIGKTFPTIGAIAGGPVGAAAGFLVQGLFDKQLKKGNEIIYNVTGTWDDPVIELVEKSNKQ